MLLALGAVIAARITETRRFIADALLLSLAGVVAAVAQWRPEVPMLVGGCGLGLSGLVLMVRFLRDSARFQEATDE